MSYLYKIFPWAMRAREMMAFITALSLYLLIGFVAGLAVIALCLFLAPLSSLWLTLGIVAALYVVAGLILSVLCYFGVL